MSIRLGSASKAQAQRHAKDASDAESDESWSSDRSLEGSPALKEGAGRSKEAALDDDSSDDDATSMHLSQKLQAAAMERCDIFSMGTEPGRGKAAGKGVGIGAAQPSPHLHRGRVHGNLLGSGILGKRGLSDAFGRFGGTPGGASGDGGFLDSLAAGHGVLHPESDCDDEGGRDSADAESGDDSGTEGSESADDCSCSDTASDSNYRKKRCDSSTSPTASSPPRAASKAAASSALSSASASVTPATGTSRHAGGASVRRRIRVRINPRPEVVVYTPRTAMTEDSDASSVQSRGGADGFDADLAMHAGAPLVGGTEAGSDAVMAALMRAGAARAAGAASPATPYRGQPLAQPRAVAAIKAAGHLGLAADDSPTASLSDASPCGSLGDSAPAAAESPCVGPEVILQRAVAAKDAPRSLVDDGAVVTLPVAGGLGPAPAGRAPAGVQPLRIARVTETGRESSSATAQGTSGFVCCGAGGATCCGAGRSRTVASLSGPSSAAAAAASVAAAPAGCSACLHKRCGDCREACVCGASGPSSLKIVCRRAQSADETAAYAGDPSLTVSPTRARAMALLRTKEAAAAASGIAGATAGAAATPSAGSSATLATQPAVPGTGATPRGGATGIAAGVRVLGKAVPAQDKDAAAANALAALATMEALRQHEQRRLQQQQQLLQQPGASSVDAVAEGLSGLLLATQSPGGLVSVHGDLGVVSGLGVASAAASGAAGVGLSLGLLSRPRATVNGSSPAVHVRRGGTAAMCCHSSPRSASSCSEASRSPSASPTVPAPLGARSANGVGFVGAGAAGAGRCAHGRRPDQLACAACLLSASRAPATGLAMGQATSSALDASGAPLDADALIRAADAYRAANRAAFGKGTESVHGEGGGTTVARSNGAGAPAAALGLRVARMGSSPPGAPKVRADGAGSVKCAPVSVTPGGGARAGAGTGSPMVMPPGANPFLLRHRMQTQAAAALRVAGGTPRMQAGGGSSAPGESAGATAGTVRLGAPLAPSAISVAEGSSAGHPAGTSVAGRL